MHVALFVRRVERPRDLRHDVRSRRGGRRALGSEHRPEVVALDEAHRDEESAFVLAGVVHGHDVRMVQRRRDLQLALEPVAEGRVGGNSGAISLSAIGRSKAVCLAR